LNMTPPHREKIFLRVSPSLKQAWVEACEARKIDQNDAGESLVALAVGQEPDVQGQLFGQQPAKAGRIVCRVNDKKRVGQQGARNGTAKKRSPQSEPDASRPALR
jgi:hypothetical protein